MKTIYEFLLSKHLLNEHLLKNKTTVSTQGIDCVDFGLPSGLLWAKCNIGADEPTEYGDYFMWGSTGPNTNDKCDWEHAPFNDGYYNYNKRYFEKVLNKICPNGILAPEYDAVTAILGDDWRMPTGDDFKELIDNTEHEWVKNYKGSNVNGILIQYNDELFIPASGYNDVSNDVSIYRAKGTRVYLWSSSIFSSSINAARTFQADDFSCDTRGGYYRYLGFCLRGVKNK